LQFLWLLDREATVWNTPDGCQASQVAKATIAVSRVVIIFAISNQVVMLTLVKQFCSFNLTVGIMLQGTKVSRAIVTMIAIFDNKMV
jgi:hypothetical protein